MIDFSVLLKAPLATAISVLTGFGLAWLIIHYTYKPRIESLQERIKWRENKIAELSSDRHE